MCVEMGGDRMRLGDVHPAGSFDLHHSPEFEQIGGRYAEIEEVHANADVISGLFLTGLIAGIAVYAMREALSNRDTS
jgi:hypothetical protein